MHRTYTLLDQCLNAVMQPYFAVKHMQKKANNPFCFHLFSPFTEIISVNAVSETEAVFLIQIPQRTRMLHNMTMLRRPTYSEADEELSAYHLGLRRCAEKCFNKGDPAVLEAIGGWFPLCPSSFLTMASCGVINVCSTTSSLHTFTFPCQDTRAASVSWWDRIK